MLVVLTETYSNKVNIHGLSFTPARVLVKFLCTRTFPCPCPGYTILFTGTNEIVHVDVAEVHKNKCHTLVVCEFSQSQVG